MKAKFVLFVFAFLLFAEFSQKISSTISILFKIKTVIAKAVTIQTFLPSFPEKFYKINLLQLAEFTAAGLV